MTWTELLQQQGKLALVIISVCIAFTSCTTRVVAQNSQPASKSQDLRMRFMPPQLSNQQEPSGSGRGTPGNREGGGSRNSVGNCPDVDKQLTALVPVTTENSDKKQRQSVLPTPESVQGLTTDGHPTFWFYVPYASPLAAEFVLLNEKGEEYYKTSFPLPGDRSFVSINLSSRLQVKPLEVGQKYQWIFSIICNPKSPSANVVVKGWVQRLTVNSSLNSQLEVVTPRDRVALYATNGIWYDALNLLGELKFTNPADKAIAADWVELLQSVGLNHIAEETNIQHYTPKPL